MPTTEGYNGAYTGPQIDAGIARANQAITVTGSGSASMAESLGTGPYTIEFTEESGSGGGSLPDGSAGQILGYVEDNVVGPILSCEKGSYVGTGGKTEKDAVVLTFQFPPKIVFFASENDSNQPGGIPLVYPQNYCAVYLWTSSTDRGNVVWSGNSVKFWASNPAAAFNNSGTTFHYYALG